ncbi:MAG: Cu(I)-responsive transcriptional regulator [Aquabacterium sp.]
MNIGQAAAASGMSVKMIRHYEDIGLLPAVQRSGSGYRQYGEVDVETLRFIRQARDLGFSLQAIDQLASLWRDSGRTSREVKAIALQHIRELDRKAKELLVMKATLSRLVRRCRGDGRPECPIIDSLAS